ncbi:hypothetical protein AYO40_00490 [Planctomycetaceae bacterium SCGC AG-212-D15]|nr:hypothetical protein AYO40_00490 [Planctomycetaceae bacterium SCGC AG-212-D15]
MTEKEWLACNEPNLMLAHLADHELTARKQRLFDCACVRRIWHLLLDERGREAVEVAERYADGAASLDEVREAQGIALAAADAQATLYLPGVPNSFSVLSAAAGTAWEFRSGADPLQHVANTIAWEGLAENGASERRAARAKLADEQKRQATLLIEVVGNPFRPIVPDRDWFSFTVLALAKSIYDDRAFDRLPILADALEEAGCTNAEILEHLRSGGEHVRGCWALDLVLGKT